MQVGFSVLHQRAEIEVHIHAPKSENDPELLSFSQQGNSVALLMGNLYYQHSILVDLQKHISNELFQKCKKNSAALVLSLYRQGGTTSLKRLEGDFALVIWGAETNQLIGMRDPLGGYPLFWTTYEGRSAFSTSIRPLLSLKSLHVLNIDYLTSFLTMAAPRNEGSGEGCVYKGIQRTLPGTLVIINDHSQKIERYVYWDWFKQIKDPGTDDMAEITNQYKSLLWAAVHERLRGRTIAHLSGGMDSTSIALIAQDLVQSGFGADPLHTLSLVYNQLPTLARERPYIESVLQHEKGIIAHRVPGDDLLDFDSFLNPPLHDEPYASLWRLAMDQATVEMAAKVGAATLLTCLPDYMVPACFVRLDIFPLTNNGKIAQQALAAPGEAPWQQEAHEAARNAVEETLLAIWKPLLGLEQISIHDNFFYIGGHSLLATQLLSRVRSTFHIELSLQLLFDNVTIAKLAECIASARPTAQEQNVTPLGSSDLGNKLPLSCAQQRLWMLDQYNPHSPLYNMPAAVRLQGELNGVAFERSLQEIVRRQASFRTIFVLEDDQPTQLIIQDIPFSLQQIDLHDLLHEERARKVQQLIQEEAGKPFRLDQAPLLRATLLWLDTDEYIFVLTMPHIIGDGWSMGVLIQELKALYQAYRQGLPSPLAELPIQYVDYALWQRQWLQGEVLKAQTDYWTQKLANLPVLQLPTLRPYAEGEILHEKALFLTIPAALAASLNELSQSEDATLFMVLLAVFQIVLASYSGQDEIVVGTDIANRNRGETENLIGFFINQLVLRSHIAESLPFVDFLKNVRQSTLEAYDHQDVPFERIVGILNPGRNISQHPLFQVKIVFHNTPTPTLELPDLQISPLVIHTELAKYDLLFDLEEVNGKIVGSLKYAVELFSEKMMLDLLASYETVVAAVVSNSSIRLSELLNLLRQQAQQHHDNHSKESRAAKARLLKSIKRPVRKIYRGKI